MSTAEKPIINHAFLQDQHERFARMRQDAPAQPAVTADGLPVYLITSYPEARIALADPRFGKDFKRTQELIDVKLPQGRTPLSLDVVSHMLNSDPPDHTRLRKLVMKAFTARRVENLRPRVEAITGELLDSMAGESEVDLLDRFAFPLPITVISELLGVRSERREDFRVWTSKMFGGDDMETRRQAAIDMTAYLTELIEEKRASPSEDLISGLIEASEEDQDSLSGAELVAMVLLLLIAGHETTVNLIGNSVLALLDNPDQLAALQADPSLVTGAVEEALRFQSPVNLATLRHTREAVRLGEVEIPEGELVLVALGSANRDAEQFDDPDRFDITRSTSAHVAFGHGIHFCLGAPLARMEGQIALLRLFERFPKLTLAGPAAELTWRFSVLVRGLDRFPVRLGA